MYSRYFAILLIAIVTQRNINIMLLSVKRSLRKTLRWRSCTSETAEICRL